MAVHWGGRSIASRRTTAPAFYPSSLGSYIYALWDAELPGTLTLDTAAVTTWRSAVGTFAPTQATAGNKPAYSATSFNGRPGVTFAATSSKYLEAASPSLPALAVPCEMWALISQDELVGAATAGTVFSYGANNAARLVQRVVNVGANRGQGIVGTGGGNTPAVETTVDFSGIHVIRVRFTATATYVSVDGSAEVSAAAVPATVATRLRIGANANSTVGAYLTGIINWMGILAPLDATQAALLLASLKARGGIA